MLTSGAAGRLLQVDAGAVLALAEAGDLPGRRLGGEWRFARRAVLEWLGAGEPVMPRRRSMSSIR